MKTITSLKALCAAAGVVALAVMAPAQAQQYVEEIVVEGYQGKLPRNVDRAATVVSYADLDLTTDWGRDELRQRVRLTARYLCEKLGETDHSSGVVPSCQDKAYRDTMKRVGTVEANAVPRGAAWVQPPRWAAPYPAAWVEETTTTRTYQQPTYQQPSQTHQPPAQSYQAYPPQQPSQTQYYTPPSEPYYEY